MNATGLPPRVIVDLMLVGQFGGEAARRPPMERDPPRWLRALIFFAWACIAIVLVTHGKALLP